MLYAVYACAVLCCAVCIAHTIYARNVSFYMPYYNVEYWVEGKAADHHTVSCECDRDRANERTRVARIAR